MIAVVDKHVLSDELNVVQHLLSILRIPIFLDLGYFFIF